MDIYNSRLSWILEASMKYLGVMAHAFVCTFIFSAVFRAVLVLLLLPSPRQFMNSIPHRQTPSAIFLTLLKPATAPHDDVCSICVDEFTNPVSLACGHCFCNICIRTALTQSSKCPLCQRKVFGKASARENFNRQWRESRRSLASDLFFSASHTGVSNVAYIFMAAVYDDPSIDVLVFVCLWGVWLVCLLELWDATPA